MLRSFGTRAFGALAFVALFGRAPKENAHPFAGHLIRRLPRKPLEEDDAFLLAVLL